MNIGYLQNVGSIILLVSLLMLLFACGGGSSSKSNDTVGNEDVQSPGNTQLDSQERFIAARGKPNMFSIMLMADESADTSATTATGQRRIETWIYDGKDAKSVVFDNGYFVEELIEHDANLALDEQSINPADIPSTLSVSDVKAIYGTPYQEQTRAIFGKSYHEMNYLKTSQLPLISFVFIDSKLAAVSAGFQFEYEPGDDEIIIITPVN